MVYDITWALKAEKQFGRLDRPTKKRVIAKLESIKDEPFLYITRLVGFDAYKLRVGNYRVLLSIEKRNLVILSIGHRKNVYKKY